MAAIFAKTAQGQEEIASRKGGLTPRERRVLILIDGKRSVDDLRNLIVADDLTHTLGALEEGGHITLTGVIDEAGTLQHTNGPLPALTAFRPLSQTEQRDTLDMARHFMINTLRTFAGPTIHIGLMEKIYVASNHLEMRDHFDAWYRAIIDTRDGRRRAEELRGDLLKVI